MLGKYDFAANVHLYHWKDLNILLDVNSGAIHLLDELSNFLIMNIIKYKGSFDTAINQAKQRYPEADVWEAAGEIRHLQATGALFTAPEIPKVDLSTFRIKAVCLNVAHACNMLTIIITADYNKSGVFVGVKYEIKFEVIADPSHGISRISYSRAGQG
jgi:uncharacterized protein